MIMVLPTMSGSAPKRVSQMRWLKTATRSPRSVSSRVMPRLMSAGRRIVSNASPHQQPVNRFSLTSPNET